MKKSIIIPAVVGTLCLLTGCDLAPTRKNVTTTVGPPNTRFTATDYGTIRLREAKYEEDRTIVVLKDNETEVEYLLVQGMGATQMVRFRSGKTTTTREAP